jgi:hypothetical protein
VVAAAPAALAAAKASLILGFTELGGGIQESLSKECSPGANRRILGSTFQSESKTEADYRKAPQQTAAENAGGTMDTGRLVAPLD